MYGGTDVSVGPTATTYINMTGTGCSSDNLFGNLQVLAVYVILPFKDEAQTALFKDPVRTAL
jgi:hypothetical protein